MNLKKTWNFNNFQELNLHLQILFSSQINSISRKISTEASKIIIRDSFNTYKWCKPNNLC